MRIADGDTPHIKGVNMDVMHTPGHTDESYSFLMWDRVFTGDTLMIRGERRTDFQNGDPRAWYESLFGRLPHPHDETLVYPAHDYKGDAVNTTTEETAFNPRLWQKQNDMRLTPAGCHDATCTAWLVSDGGNYARHLARPHQPGAARPDPARLAHTSRRNTTVAANAPGRALRQDQRDRTDCQP